MIGRARRRVVRALPEPTLRRLQRVRHRETPDITRAAPRAAPRGVSAQVVTDYDAVSARAEVVAAITRGLEHGHVPFVLVPGPHASVREIAVSLADRPAAIAAIESGLTGAGWTLSPSGGTLGRARRIRVLRALAAPGGQLLTGSENGCDVTFWTPVTRSDLPRADGDPHLPGTLLAPGANGVTAYVTGDSWQRASTAATHWLEERTFPDIFETRAPIDLVYTWVDGEDPAWQARKAEHAPDAHAATAHHTSAVSDARYLHRDELRFSLRSVAMYASWVRTIYLVTDGQVPAWLDTSHPRIVVVDHRDIFTAPAALPVFNSHAIESQLHHIDGLAEQYLYLNDDMFFGAPVDPELFFHSNGLATFFLGRDTVDLDPPSVRDLPVISAAKNLRSLVEQDFGVTVRGKFRHAAHPQLRSVVAELEQRYPQMFAQVAGSRFRHPDDVSIPSALSHYYAYLVGRAVPGVIGYRYQDLAKHDTARRLDEILRQRPQAFCLNDVAAATGSGGSHGRAVEQFLHAYFPLAAPWEKAAPREKRSPGPARRRSRGVDK